MGESFWADFYWFHLFQLRIFRDSVWIQLQVIIKQLAGGNSNIFWVFLPRSFGEKYLIWLINMFEMGWFNHQLDNPPSWSI